MELYDVFQRIQAYLSRNKNGNSGDMVFSNMVNFGGMAVQRLDLISFISYSTTYFTEGRSNLPRDPIASRGMSVSELLRKPTVL